MSIESPDLAPTDVSDPTTDDSTSPKSDDYIGDAGRMLDNEQPLDDPHDDKTDETETSQETRPDEAGTQPPQSEEPHPDPGDLSEPPIDIGGKHPLDDKPSSHDDDYIGDADRMLDEEQPLDDSYGDKTDGNETVQEARSDDIETKPQESEEPHPGTGDFPELSVGIGGRNPPDDEPPSHNEDKLGDADRMLDNEQPLEDLPDEADSGVDSRPVPESSIEDNGEAELGNENYDDAQADSDPSDTTDAEQSPDHDRSCDIGNLGDITPLTDDVDDSSTDIAADDLEVESREECDESTAADTAQSDRDPSQVGVSNVNTEDITQNKSDNLCDAKQICDEHRLLDDSGSGGAIPVDAEDPDGANDASTADATVITASVDELSASKHDLESLSPGQPALYDSIQSAENDAFLGMETSNESATSSLDVTGTERVEQPQASNEVSKPTASNHTSTDAIDPSMPPALRTAEDGPPFATTKLNPLFDGETEGKSPEFPPGHCVRYLDAAEREELRLMVNDGQLYKVNGDPFDTSEGTSLWGGDDRRAIFVMDQYGNLYASNDHVRGKFHHSSFLAGERVAGAGEMRVVNGRLEFISDNSGHYEPEPEYLEQVKDRLKQEGIDFNGVQCEKWRDRGVK
jgi:hypothetical protein